MIKNNHILVVQKVVTMTLILIGINILQAQRTINCADDDCLENAMFNALPGDEIILKAGVTFVGGARSVADNFSAFSSDRDGTSSAPIILRGEFTTNRPIISANRSGYSWYGINLSGDYWIIEDIIVQGVLKGIVLDSANNCQLNNLKVFDVGQEAIHLRTGSSNNVIKGCTISDTGKRSETDKGFGEGVYVGSDRSAHNKFDPNCNNNFIEDCVFGPNISAEALDIKEGTERTIVRNNTFFANGITGANSGDSFIDLKGIYGYVYGNTFNVLENAEAINSIVDISNRTFGSYNYKTGTNNAVFENTINLYQAKSSLQTVRIILDAEKQPSASKNMHAWDNIRNSSSAENVDDVTMQVVKQFCPSWNEFRSCNTLSINTAELNPTYSIYPNPGKDIIHIKTTHLTHVNRITINAMEGKTLYSSKLQTLDEEINISNLPNGVYILSLVTPNNTISKKLIKN